MIASLAEADLDRVSIVGLSKAIAERFDDEKVGEAASELYWELWATCPNLRPA